MGGYKILDFKDIDLSTGDAVIPGLYNAIDESDKPFIVYNLFDGTHHVKPMFIPLMNKNDTTYEFYITSPLGTITISIGSDDDVIILE